MDVLQDECAFEENSGGEDYLQDPELWEDRLPQPYRMIQHILDILLDDTWDYIEHLDIRRQQEAVRVEVPEGTNGTFWCREVLTEPQGGVCGGRGVVFVGNGKSVLVMGCGSETSGQILAEHTLQQEVSALAVVQRGEVHMVLVQQKTEIKVLGFVLNEVIEVAGFPHPSKEKIVKMSVSSTCSHVAVASNTNENEIKLSVYILPIDSWQSELPHTAERWSQTSVPSGKKGAAPHTDDAAYSKPVLLYSLSQPPPFNPSMASSPFTAFQSVCEQAGATVPSGDLHSLTKTYFENRRKRFVSKRQHFVSPLKSDTPTTTPQHPTCHFLYYRFNHKHAAACEIAVWWEGSLSLMCYPLQEHSGKSAVVHPSRHMPQASTILCSCLSDDSSMLALGLKSGTVVLWDNKMNVCCKVCSCVASPDEISSLIFLPSPPPDEELETALQLGIGTAQGKVMVLEAAMNSNTPARPLNTRVKKQQEVYEGMFSSSGYDVQSRVMWFEVNPHLPSLLTSVHADGKLVFWSHTQQEAVCKLTCTGEYSLTAPPLSSTFSDDGQHVFVTGNKGKDSSHNFVGKSLEMEDNGCLVISYDLSSVRCLAGFWDEACSGSLDSEHASSLHGLELLGDRGTSKMPPPLLDAAEMHMRNYVKLRLLRTDEDSMTWHKHWKELPNRLRT